MATNETLYIIAVITNPVNFNRRFELFKRFQDYVHRTSKGTAKLISVESAFGSRPFRVTSDKIRPGEQRRTYDELWHKENMINVGMRNLPHDWEYVAWIDGDIEWIDNDDSQNWAEATIQQLQHFMFVQMWSHATDLGPNTETIGSYTSFAYNYQRNGANPPRGPGRGGEYLPYDTYWHPGYAWAARREAIEAVGGLIDRAILGAGDHHMALCMIGLGERSFPKEIHPHYKDMIMNWQDNCERVIKRDIGYVQATLIHHFHGAKKNRQYYERWKVLTENQYSPLTDVRFDWQGMLSLNVHTPRQMRLRDQLRFYFRQRNEDSIDA